MKIRDRKCGFSLLDVIIIIVITGVVSALTTGLILFSGTKYSTGISYFDLSKDPAVIQFLEVYSKLVDNYYEDVNKNEMINSAINAMMEYLGEDYSTYLNEGQTQALAEKISGYYEGIGIIIREDKVIKEIYDETPAQKVGLQVNDTIIKINEESFFDRPYEDVTAQIKKMADSEFSITVLREETELTYTLKREKILYPVTYREIIEQNNTKIGYLALSTFSQTSGIQVERAITKLEEDGMEVLILDLRGNSGGLLSAAEEISSQFIEKDKIIYSLEEKKGTHIYKDKTDKKFDKEIIVLTNGGTASASEILTAALRDSYGITIVGEKTYGKGKVQQTNKLDDGSMVKFTTAKWLTPSGMCIDAIGIRPDYEVKLPEVTEANQVIEDTQLQKAIEIAITKKN